MIHIVDLNFQEQNPTKNTKDYLNYISNENTHRWASVLNRGVTIPTNCSVVAL